MLDANECKKGICPYHSQMIRKSGAPIREDQRKLGNFSLGTNRVLDLAINSCFTDLLSCRRCLIVIPWHRISMLTTAHQDTSISHLTEDVSIIVQEISIYSL